MASPRRLYAVRILWVILAAALMAGCADDQVTEPEQEAYVNPDKPNANTLIRAQNTFGNSDTWSSAWKLKPDGEGGYYFNGANNGVYGVGRLNSDGALRWFTNATDRPLDFHVLSQDAQVPHGVLLVGGSQESGDGQWAQGFVSLVGTSGALLDQVLCVSDTSDIWLNSIAPISDSTFLVVGTEESPSRKEPFVVVIELTPEHRIENRQQAVISDISNSGFGGVAVDAGEQTSTELSFYALSGTNDGAYGGILSGHKVSMSWPSLATCSVEWTQEIIAKPGYRVGVSTGSLELYQDCLYIVGNTADPDKQPEPSDGGFWRSAVVASLSLEGDVRWLSTIPVTQHTERFYGCSFGPDGLYALGVAAFFTRAGQTFGYGWISRVSLDTGEVVSNMMFGDDAYRSGLCDAVVAGSEIRCSGWTMRRTDQGGYLGWFCDVDISDPPASLLAAPWRSAEPGDCRGPDDTMGNS